MNYNYFAKDFSRTRYSVWKGVKSFLDQIQPLTNNIEVGCGNGKNMMYLKRRNLSVKGIDISQELVKICKEQSLDAAEGDILNLNTEENYDNVFCVAVIHHLQTKEERIGAISNLINITKKGGKILIYVWAITQPENMQKRFLKFRDIGLGNKIVLFQTREGNQFERFYHFYSDGELEEEIKKSPLSNQVKIDNVYWEEGNWVAILSKI